MSSPADHVAVLKNIETELNSVQQIIPGLEHSANTGVLPQWRLIEAQTKFFDAGDRLASMAPHVKHFSATEKAQLDTLFENSNMINAKLIRIHERREAMAFKYNTPTQAPSKEPQDPWSPTLMAVKMVEEKKQMLRNSPDQGRSPPINEWNSKPLASPTEGSYRSLPIRQPLNPSQGLQADRKTVLENTSATKARAKRVSACFPPAQNSTKKEFKTLSVFFPQGQNRMKAEAEKKKKEDFTNAVYRKLAAHKTYDAVIEGKTKLAANLRQHKAEVSTKATGKVVEQDIFFEAPVKNYASEVTEECDQIQDQNVAGKNDACMDAMLEETKKVPSCGEDKLNDEELVEESGELDEVVEEWDDGGSNSGAVGEESGKGCSEGDSDEVYEAVDLSGEEATIEGNDADLEDDDFVLIETDEADGAPEQPWSPNERTHARACVVM